MATTTRELKQIFFDVYDGFADKRVKNLDNGSRFIVDDRSNRDEDARGQLFSWFCQIFLEVIDQDSIRIIMCGGVPEGPLVEEWFTNNGVEKTDLGFVLIVSRHKERGLSELALAFQAIVRPGAHYSVKSYKYVCPRVAAALDKVQKVLEQAWAH